MSESVIDVIREVLVDVKDVDPSSVTAEAGLVDDLGVDSLDAVQIILALEDHYGKEVDDESIEGLETVGDIVALIESLLE